MLDPSVIRILSGLLALVLFVSYILFFGVFIRKKLDQGSVRASKFILINVWFLLGSLPLIFYVLGAAVPSWVYGTPLNLSFNGAEILRFVSVFIVLSGLVLLLWRGRVLGRFMRVEIEFREKHELVTRAIFSHQASYVHRRSTGGVGDTLLFLNLVLVIGFLARVAMAYKRAILEEELLSSPDGFGQSYKDYMIRTGRFLPSLARHKPRFTSRNRERTFMTEISVTNHTETI